MTLSTLNSSGVLLYTPKLAGTFYNPYLKIFFNSI